MRVFAVLGLGLIGCLNEPLVDVCVDDTPCSVFDGVIQLEGSICGAGRLVCSSDEAPQCVGYVGRSYEICDGLDNDCNGEVDDALPRNHPPDYEDRCPNVGECVARDLFCIGGNWVCQATVGPTPEVCDGVDNDCDGEVDEGLAAVFTYPEDRFPNTVGVGQCRPSVAACINGVLESIPAVVPVSEAATCGDGLDNDCDGIVDEEDGAAGERGYVIAIDMSSSFSPFYDNVLLGLLSWVSSPSQENSTFTIVQYGVSSSLRPNRHVRVALTLGSRDAAISMLDYMYTVNIMGGGEEYQMEAIIDGAAASAGLSGPMNVVIFSDEGLQFYDVPGDVRAALDIQCSETPYSLTVFAQPSHFSEWEPAVAACGGAILPLAASAAAIETALDLTFFSRCSF